MPRKTIFCLRAICNNVPGFTLIEMLIIVFIIASIAMAMTSMPSFTSSLDDARLRAAVSEVVTALEFGQLEAMRSGRKIQVRIGHIGNLIRVKKKFPMVDLLGSEDQLAETDVEGGVYRFVSHPLKRGEDYEIIFDDLEHLKGISITASNFGGDNLVRFEPDGIPDSGGSSTLILGSRQMSVSLDALTGKVRVNN